MFLFTNPQNFFQGDYKCFNMQIGFQLCAEDVVAITGSKK